MAKLIVASSRAIYGEGKYECPEHAVVYPAPRNVSDLRMKRFEPLCPVCARPCVPLPTSEDSPFHPISFYGLTKQVQEQMTLMLSGSLDISAFALRYQNVYGPGQSLTNPYTGILTIFATRAHAGLPINVFEDGLESRDFVYIDDAVEATFRCLKADMAARTSLNVGTGQRVTVAYVANEIAKYFSTRSAVVISGEFRIGDIRHNFASVARAQELIGFKARCRFDDGLKEFLNWAVSQNLSTDSTRYELSLREMRERRLLDG